MTREFIDQVRLAFGSSGPAVTKERFFELCEEYGINRALASDLWYMRPIDHRNDPEDAIIGNLKLLSQGDWIERNNLLALQLQRHPFEGAGGKCDRCNAHRIYAIHNTEVKPELPAGVCTVCENEPCECEQNRDGDMSLARRRRRGGRK